MSIELQKTEYESLRREIEITKGNIFRTITFGLVGIPGMYFVSNQFDIHELFLAIPLMVIVIGLLYLAENHSLMRCGKYIKENIEPQSEGRLGWEAWLSDSQEDRRTVDKLLIYAFYLMFCVYYIGATIIAAKYAFTHWKMLGLSVVLGTYIGLGIMFGWFIVKNMRTSTTTK